MDADVETLFADSESVGANVAIGHVFFLLHGVCSADLKLGSQALVHCLVSESIVVCSRGGSLACCCGIGILVIEAKIDSLTCEIKSIA